jgi:hypothetical protein
MCGSIPHWRHEGRLQPAEGVSGTLFFVLLEENRSSQQS